MRLVALDAERQRKRVQAGALEIGGEFGNARFVRHGRICVRRARGRLGRIYAVLSAHRVEMFRARIVRFEVFIANRPRRRNAAVMHHFAEIAFPESQQRRAIKLRARHVVPVHAPRSCGDSPARPP